MGQNNSGCAVVQFRVHQKLEEAKAALEAAQEFHQHGELVPLPLNIIQWGSEYQTSLVFKWSKKVLDAKWSGFQMPFEYRTA